MSYRASKFNVMTLLKRPEALQVIKLEKLAAKWHNVQSNNLICPVYEWSFGDADTRYSCFLHVVGFAWIGSCCFATCQNFESFLPFSGVKQVVFVYFPASFDDFSGEDLQQHELHQTDHQLVQHQLQPPGLGGRQHSGPGSLKYVKGD